MTDVERIPTTERHAELVEVAARAVMLASTTHAYDEDMPLKNEVAVAEAVIAAVEPMIRADERAGLSAIKGWDDAMAYGARRERVRVVEGLVATINAQLRFSPMARTDEAVMRGDPDNGDYILRAKALEALEAAREDTT